MLLSVCLQLYSYYTPTLVPHCCSLSQDQNSAARHAAVVEQGVASMIKCLQQLDPAAAAHFRAYVGDSLDMEPDAEQVICCCNAAAFCCILLSTLLSSNGARRRTDVNICCPLLCYARRCCVVYAVVHAAVLYAAGAHTAVLDAGVQCWLLCWTLGCNVCLICNAG